MLCFKYLQLSVTTLCMFFFEMKEPQNHLTCTSKPRPSTHSIFLLICVHFLEYLQYLLQRFWVLHGKKVSPLGNQTQVPHQDISELQKVMVREGKLTRQMLNTHLSVAPLLPHTAGSCLGCALYTHYT